MRHGDKYDYTEINMNETYNRFYCRVHMSYFTQSRSNHLCYSGCKLCYTTNNVLTNERYIEIAKHIWGEETYDYSKIKYVELKYHDKTTDENKTVKAKEINYKNKAISLVFETKIGRIIFNGQFLGEHGPTNDNVDDNQKIMVLKGILKINEDYDMTTMFSYFGGE